MPCNTHKSEKRNVGIPYVCESWNQGSISSPRQLPTDIPAKYFGVKGNTTKKNQTRNIGFDVWCNKKEISKKTEQLLKLRQSTDGRQQKVTGSWLPVERPELMSSWFLLYNVCLHCTMLRFYRQLTGSCWNSSYLFMKDLFANNDLSKFK